MIKSTDVKEKMEDPATTYDKCCQSTLCKIVNDQTHPLHNYITILRFLPHVHLNVTFCKTARFQNTVIPSAITLSTVNYQMDDLIYY